MKAIKTVLLFLGCGVISYAQTFSNWSEGSDQGKFKFSEIAPINSVGFGVQTTLDAENLTASFDEVRAVLPAFVFQKVFGFSDGFGPTVEYTLTINVEAMTIRFIDRTVYALTNVGSGVFSGVKTYEYGPISGDFHIRGKLVGTWSVTGNGLSSNGIFNSSLSPIQYYAMAGRIGTSSFPTSIYVDAAEYHFTTGVADNLLSLEFDGRSLSAGVSQFEFTGRTASTPPYTLTRVSLPVIAELFHDADTDQDHQFNLSELLRVIELYNSRFGSVRTGRYVNSTDSNDGYGTDSVTAPNTASQLTRHHSADTDENAELNLSELLRVIEIYNYRDGTRRTGHYHEDSKTEDGFESGP